ncbi:putative GH25 family protein [Flavobacterium sp. HSC-32F16]|uniref:hypothetical protein n=1 Tax=Flavobacterium sp. HSC-32F16 TaxID=2910964 RepID=UPI0020A2CBEB|nr:hypothetical protein [Flavobacterium sp. HSC-32F16]MCP2026657.1 putative GH25 family protein [Flavobacterium sp. HSC-32F16]
MKSVIYAFVLMLVVSSCASFSNRMINKNKSSLSENDLVKLEGTYALFPDLKYDEKGKVHSIDSQDPETRYNLNYFVKSEKSKYDYSDSYMVEVKFLDKNRLQFITKKENAIIENVELGGKLKNGLFYLDNKYLKRNGVPYLAGGYDNYKTRIGLSKDNGLLVNYAFDNSGALLFMFWAGSTYNLGYHYKRIEK